MPCPTGRQKTAPDRILRDFDAIAGEFWAADAGSPCVCVNPRRGARSRKIPVSNLYSKRPDAGIALMAVAASTGEHQKRKERPEGRPISSQTKSRELLTRAHLRGDPRDGRVAGPHEPCRPANARPRRQRGPYSRFARQLD